MRRSEQQPPALEMVMVVKPEALVGPLAITLITWPHGEPPPSRQVPSASTSLAAMPAMGAPNWSCTVTFTVATTSPFGQITGNAQVPLNGPAHATVECGGAGTEAAASDADARSAAARKPVTTCLDIVTPPKESRDHRG